MSRQELIAAYAVQSPIPGDFVGELIASEQSLGPFAPLTDPTLEQQIMARVETRSGEIPVARPETVTKVASGIFGFAFDAAFYCTGMVLNVADGR